MNSISKRILSILLVVVMCLTTMPSTAFAAETDDVYTTLKTEAVSSGDMMDALSISRGILATVIGISAIDKNTDNPGTAAMVNNWFLGAFDLTMAELQAVQVLSKQMASLHLEGTANQDFIEQKMDSILSDIEKTLGSDAAADAYDNYLLAWNTDVSAPLADNGYQQVVTAYKNYLEYAGSHKVGTPVIYNGQEVIATQEMVEDCRDSFRAALEAFSGCDYDASAGFEDQTAYYDHILYETDAIDRKAVSAINALIGRMINANSGSAGTRYLDRAAQVAYAYFPYSEDQADFMDAAVMKQSNELLMALLTYQELIGMRIEYGEAKYEALKASEASETDLEALRNELDKYYAPNKNIKDFIYGGRACNHIGGVTAALNTWLSAPIYISDSDNSYLYLEDYIRATDADTFVLINTNFAEQSDFDTILAESKAGKISSVIDEMINTELIDRDKVEKHAVSSADTVTEQVEFIRRGVVVVNPNGEATVKPVYLLADTTDDKSDRLLQDLNWEKTAQDATDLEGYRFAVPHADYYNLRDGVYSDGCNEFTMVSADELQALVNNKPLSAQNNILRDYFADVLGEYPEGKKLVMLTDDGTASGNAENKYYTEYKGIDMLNPTSFVTENVTPDASDNTSYTVMLAGEKVTYGKLTTESDSMRTGLSGEGYDAQTGKVAAASAVTLTVTPTECRKINRITAQYHEDPTNPDIITYSEVLVDESTADSLSYNDDGSVELVYYMPYTDVTLYVESENGHTFSDNGFCPTCGAYEPAVMTKKGYRISNAGQLYWFSAAVREDMVHISYDDFTHLEDGQTMADLNCTVTAPIDLSAAGDPWVPIGTAEVPYLGEFDGQNHPITNLKGTLFGYTENVTLRNIAIESGTFGSTDQGQEYIGSIVNRLDGESDIIRCYSKAVCAGSAAQAVGGLAGYVENGIIQDCYFAGSLSSTSDCDVGGLIGCCNAGTLNNSFAYSNSLAGRMTSGSFENCYFLSDTEDSFDGTTAMTAARFASGEVAYKLGSSWGQTLDGEEKQAYPVLGGAKVYYGYKDCSENASLVYTNNSNVSPEKPDHSGGTATCTKQAICEKCGTSYGEPDSTKHDETASFDANGFCIFGCYEPAKYNETTGYYEIGNAGQLYWFAQQVNGGNPFINGELTADIVINKDVLKEDGELNGSGSNFREWTPIGNDSTPFYGIFDGKGHTISGLYFNDNSANYVGLFGLFSGTVQNVGVEDSYLRGNTYVGGVVGISDGTITNCYNTGAVYGNSAAVGGVAGGNYGTITNCYNTGTVTSRIDVGGVVGGNSGTITNCYYLTGTANGGINGEDVAGQAEAKTAEQFASGEVAYKLGSSWGQTLDGEEKQAYPVLGGAKVYYGYKDCSENASLVYTNNSNVSPEKPDHSGGTATCTKQAICEKCGTSYGEPDSTKHDETASFDANGFCSFGCYEPAKYNETTGYYEIGNAGQLYWFAQQVNSVDRSINGELTADIVVNKNVLKANGELNENGSNFRVWTPIGKGANVYTGTFDGKEHTVSGLYFDSDSTSNVGLFGYIHLGTVQNVGVEDSYLKGYNKVGGIAGHNGGTITNCYNAARAVGNGSTDSNVGGIAGHNGGTITNCSNTGIVRGSRRNNGGIAGINFGTITNCSNTGAVGHVGSRVGGIVGTNYENGKVTNCYNAARVFADEGYGSGIGGVAGYNYKGTIENCYNIGTVTALQQIGGVVGINSIGTIENCYYLTGTANGGINGEDVAGQAEAKTAEQFASGEVAYLLQGNQETHVWGQTLDGEEKQAYPVLGGAKVYYGYTDCSEDASPVYTNDDKATEQAGHFGGTATCTKQAICERCGTSYGELDSTKHDFNENGFCNNCDAYEPAVLVGDYYEIGNAGQLFWFAEQVNSGNGSISGKLTADIDLESSPWTPITNFSGTFDGAGYEIKNFAMNITDNGDYGLFGFVKDATIKNFTIRGEVKSTLTASPGGEFKYGVIADATGNTVITDIHSYVNFTINDSYFKNFVGGILGRAKDVSANFAIERCSFSGKLNLGSAQVDCTGGIVAYVYAYNTIKLNDCLFDGEIISTYTSTMQVGGMIGYYRGGDLTIKNCLSVGKIDVPNTTFAGMIGGRVLEMGTNISKVSNNYYYGTLPAFSDTKNTSHAYYDKDMADYAGYGDTNAKSVTDAQLKSGEIAYLLQGEQESHAWGQTIGTQDYPVLGGAKVYYGYADCGEDAVLVYTNNANASSEKHGHDYTDNNGFCKYCDAYEPAMHGMAGYAITNAGQLYWFAQQVNGGNTSINGELRADIVVNKNVLNANGELNSNASNFRVWTPIGNDSNNYVGHFYGNGYTVSGLYFNDTTVEYVGLFGYVRLGTVQNVGVEDSYLRGGRLVGGVVGLIDGGQFTNCYNTGTVTGIVNVGGVVGGNYGTITNCYNTGTVTGNSNVGGVAGGNYRTITNCYYLTGTAIGGIDGADVAGQAEAKTAEQFASGEVAYLLQGNQETHVWGQTLDGEEKQVYPVLGGAKVYYGYTDCGEDASPVYTNDDKVTEQPGHNYTDNNGFCKNCDAYEPAKYNETTGYYEIGNAGQLYWFAQQVNGGNYLKGELTANIVVNENVLDANGNLNVYSSNFREWTPIGYSSVSFSEIFDGKGHTVSGLYFFNTANITGKYVGLFGLVARTGTVQNVGVEDSYLRGHTLIGGVVGENFGTITNCYNTGTVTGGGYVGGVAGRNFRTITNCYNTGTVTGGTNVGGVAGYNSSGTITNCYYLTGTATGGIDGADVAGQAEAKTAEQFASGEVAYLLQGNQETHVWGQTLDGEEKQAYPVLGGAKVYYGYTDCGENASLVYTNNANASSEKPGHDYTDNNGFCKYCDAYEPAKYNETTGYYEIGNAGQLYWFAQQVNGGNGNINGVLTADIVVNKNVLNANGELNDNSSNFRVWTPIGNDSNNFVGTFDGKGHTVSGLYFNDTTVEYVGLFGYVRFGTVQNVGVEDSYLNGKNFVGGVVGLKEGGQITNCYNTGTVTGNSYIGGVAGRNNGGTITNCYNTGTVTGNRSIGGVAGNNNGTITNCYNTGTVTGNSGIGGVAGENIEATIKNCYNTGTVTGNSNVGGVAGSHRANRGGSITNCYYLTGTATGGINGKDVAGQAEAKTAEQFASGEVAYLLQGNQETHVWGQTLDGEEKQAYPVLGGAKVYFDETADPQYYNEKSEIISATITWGAMSFTYTDGEWDPETHTYAEGKWTPDAENGNVITVVNNSNVTVNVTFTYTKTVTEVEGSFTDESGNAITSPFALATEEEKKIKLILNGKPSSTFEDKELGSVTVSITLPDKQDP